ncbi:DNA polymerase III subunit beta [Arcanobacterium canis]
MKISVDHGIFAEAVTWASRTIPNRPAVPVLAGMKLVASEDGIVSLGSRDSDITSHIDIEAEVAEAGEVLVRGRLLADIVRALPANKPIELTLDGTTLEIECGSSRFSMKTMATEDYTELPQLPPVIGKVDGSLWQEAVGQVTIAASNDDTLPMLVSVCIEIEGNSMTLMATDRYRLAVRDLKWEAEDPTISTRILVRASRLLDVAKALDSTGPIEVSLREESGVSLIGFSAGGRQNTIQLIDGEYPQVRSLFPSEVTGHTLINRVELLDAIKRSKLVVEKNSAVRLTLTDSQMTLEAGAGDKAQFADAIEASLVGDDIKMAFNPTLLQDGVNVMNEEQVRLSFTQPTKPAVLTGESEKDGPNEEFRLLLMPIRTFGTN